MGGFTASDRTEARAAILNSLVNAFQRAWIRLTRLDVNFDNDGNKLLEVSFQLFELLLATKRALQYFQVLNYFQTDSQLNNFTNPDFLSAVKSLWRHRGVRKILTTKYWPGLDDNIQLFAVRRLLFVGHYLTSPIVL